MKASKRINVWIILKVLVLLGIVAVTLYPIIYMLAVSLSKNIYVLKNEISFYPKGLTFMYYKMVLEDKRIFTGYMNTLIYVTIGTTISLAMTTAAAYALSKKNRLPFAKGINIMILITMLFGGGMIPTYLTVTMLGMYDTIWAVVLPHSVSAMNLIIMRTFFSAFPEEIEESGRIDGLNDIGVLWYLVLPTSTAILATMALFYGVGYWNGFMDPFIYLKSADKYPLQLILRDIVLAGVNFNSEAQIAGGNDIIPAEAIKYATIIVSIVPIIVVYPFMQKYFVKGALLGSIKG